jgi:N-methylhydantoinase A
LLQRENIGPEERYSARSADMRYVGQEYTVNVPLGREISLEEIDGAFHDAHRVRYGHSTPGAPVEFVNLRLAALGRIATAFGPSAAPATGEDPRVGTRQVVFAGVEHETPVVLRDRLPERSSYEGPVVIEEESSTTLVPPGRTAALDEHRNIVITRA